MAACDLPTLLSDACSNRFKQAAQDEVMFRALMLQLLCNVSSSGGGGSVTSGDYGGLEPNFTPSGDTAIAFDTSNDAEWHYYGGAWH